MQSLIAKAAVVAVVAIGLSACAANDPHKRSKIGAGIGAVVGAVIGNQVDSGSGKYVGAVAGAIAGAAVGNYMDKQQAELEQQLAAEAARNELQITKLPGNALRVGVASDISFDFGKASIRPDARATYAKIANVLKTFDKTVIHVVGHTDSVGSDAYNQTLSERRAASVAQVLMDNGVPSARLQTEGRGEREPIASNQTDAGRARNRRVDIVIKPIVEGNEQQAYAPPPYLGK